MFRSIETNVKEKNNSPSSSPFIQEDMFALPIKA